MARKKPMQYVPLEERPEFLTLVAELASVLPEQFPTIARQCVEKYHDAVLAGHVEVLDQMERAYNALVFKLNGDTLFGCSAKADSAANVLSRAVAARPGQVPLWGQCGEFLLEVDGMRIRVEYKPGMLGNHHDCDLHAVDLDRPFLSTTGYRSAGVTAVSCLGESVEQAVRRMVEGLLKNEGKPRPMAPDFYAQKAAEKRPTWLAEALAGIKPNGQLAMFGDVPKELAAKAPLSNAERQKAFRQRQREKQAALKAEGLHALELSGVDLARLFIALDTHISFDNLLDWDLQGYQELAGRLFKGEDNAEAKVQHLGASIGVANYKKQLEANSKRGFKAYEDERDVSKKLRERLSEAQAEVRQLQQALQAIAAEVSGAPAPIEAAAPAAVAKVAKPARLTPNMAWVLEAICAGKPADHGCAGRSEHGARTQTLIALRERGLLNNNDEPTEAGRALVAKRAG